MPEFANPSSQKEFCPPLDAALLYAIISDYDLANDAVLEELRATLETLKENALAEEAAAFDPSGSSSSAFPPQLGGAAESSSSPERPRSWNGDAKSKSTESSSSTDFSLSGITGSIQSWSISEDSSRTRATNEKEQDDASFAALSPAEREMLICEMFPTLRPFDVSFALKKNRGDFSRTVEELLNHVFLFASEPDSSGETRSPPRGIEAFANNGHLSTSSARRNRARAKKRKKATSTLSRQRSSSLPSSSSSPYPDPSSPHTTTTTPASAWTTARQDVAFIAQRTHHPAPFLPSL